MRVWALAIVLRILKNFGRTLPDPWPSALQSSFEEQAQHGVQMREALLSRKPSEQC